MRLDIEYCTSHVLYVSCRSAGTPAFSRGGRASRGVTRCYRGEIAHYQRKLRSFKPMKSLVCSVCTWNVGAGTGSDASAASTGVGDWLRAGRAAPADVQVVALQEVVDINSAVSYLYSPAALWTYRLDGLDERLQREAEALLVAREQRERTAVLGEQAAAKQAALLRLASRLRAAEAKLAGLGDTAREVLERSDKAAASGRRVSVAELVAYAEHISHTSAAPPAGPSWGCGPAAGIIYDFRRSAHPSALSLAVV